MLFGAGQLQTAQHAALARLPPRLVARPHHADGEPAVGVEPLAEVAAHRHLALLLADLLNARRRRRCGVGPVLAAREGPHVHRLRDLEAVLALAVDDLGRVRVALRPVQAVAALGLAERLGTAQAEGYRAGADRVAPSPRGSAVSTPAISSPPSAVNNSARRVDVACRLRHHVTFGVGCSASSAVKSTRSGASNIRSIVTGAPGAVTSEADVTLWGCAPDGRVCAVIDLKLLRENPDVVRASQRARGEDPGLVDALLEADAARRAAVSAADNLRAEQKAASKKVGAASKEERPALLAAGEGARREGQGRRGRAVGCREGVHRGAHGDLQRHHRRRPVRRRRRLRGPRHRRRAAWPSPTRKTMWPLASRSGLFDLERGAKVSGARFYFLTGYGALLQLGLMQLAVRLATDNGFTLVIPPVLVRPEIMEGTGFLGAHSEEVYRLEADDLYLVGTSEVPLAGYHSDEILDLSAGPLRYAGWSSCFRREAGSHGKDTRGIIRVHQFDKVEGFVYCRPEEAEAEHDRLLGWERQMLANIEVPYRVIDIAAGDLGASAARKYDCEAWIPTQQTYRELTSTSNCTTFQARRLAIRYRDENGKPQTAATLNGTLATTRWLVAILENHQQPDGSVRVPEALVPYVGTEVLEPR